MFVVLAVCDGAFVVLAVCEGVFVMLAVCEGRFVVLAVCDGVFVVLAVCDGMFLTSRIPTTLTPLVCSPTHSNELSSKFSFSTKIFESLTTVLQLCMRKILQLS